MSLQQSLALCTFRGLRLVRRGGNFGTFRYFSVGKGRLDEMQDYCAKIGLPSILFVSGTGAG
eukprot:2363204-Amphidinium_carterae.1